MFDSLINETLRVRDEIETEVEYIVVVVERDGLRNLNERPLDERLWRDSGCKDWWFRIDPPNPQLQQRRHVHVARRKHINTKDKQRAWNDDGTPHDKATFTQSDQGIEMAKKIAAKALHLDADLLERAAEQDEEQFRSVCTTDLVETSPVLPVLFVVRAD